MRFAVVMIMLMLSGCTGGMAGGTSSSDRQVQPDAEAPVDALDAPVALLPTVYAAPNVDDDDGNRESDFDQFGAPGDDDLRTLTLKLPRAQEGARYTLVASGDSGYFRVWYQGNVVLGHDGANGLESFELPTGVEDVSLEVEVAALDLVVDLRLYEQTSDGNGEEVADGQIVGAPLILSHHLESTEQVFVVGIDEQGFGNNAMVSEMRQVLGSLLTVIPGTAVDGDPWAQDEMEFGRVVAEDSRIDVIIDSVRNRGLDVVPETLAVGDTVSATWGRDDRFSATSADSFGNLETSPPVVVNGVVYPMGRTYWGGSPDDDRGLEPNEEMVSMLEDQRVQAPFEVDTSWLCVGHVDEFISFVPDRASAKGFKMLYTDVDEAYALLARMDGTQYLPRYAQDFGYSTVGQIRGDRGLRTLNNRLQAEVLDPILAQLKRELGLTEDDVIRVPAIFSDEEAGCGGAVAALIPGTVNLLEVNGPDGRVHLFAPDPFMRDSDEPESQDAFIQDFEGRMPADVEVHWLDAWDVYHINLGEVHCGTNQRRTPSESARRWWENTEHLRGN